ncbi:hypothetical protein [Lactiplantibacillus xiangfangensis]|uniref:hypothetical protein n=1 Tax=Lactiplantibacillus xiangfangensis TaxID=942150 RepID=UPI00070937AF|nr:hypothetical protein [Lactiplantibacillus xiangfangensis]
MSAMGNAQTIFEGLHDQIQKNRDLFELRKLRDAIIDASKQGKMGMTWGHSVIDDDVANALLSEGIVVIKCTSKNDYLLDWSEIYEEM